MPKLGIILPNMGTVASRPQQTLPARRGCSLADALFTRTQQRVLGLLFGQPARSFYATELIGLAGIGSGAVQRELARLVRSGLVTVRSLGNQRHYQANPDAPLFAELCGIVLKTVGLADPLREVLQPLAGQIDAAFVFGSVAKRQDTAASDIDLMVISDSLSYGDIFAALEAAEARLPVALIDALSSSASGGVLNGSVCIRSVRSRNPRGVTLPVPGSAISMPRPRS